MWEGVAYRLLDDAAPARTLFDFAAAPWPSSVASLLCWGAFAPAEQGERLIGAVAAAGVASAAMLHGPVVVAGEGPLDIAAQLVAAILDHAVAAGAQTLFARPQGVDRIWIRFGFIPVPEETLPAGFHHAGRTPTGLYAWRGGSALWSLRALSTG